MSLFFSQPRPVGINFTFSIKFIFREIVSLKKLLYHGLLSPVIHYIGRWTLYYIKINGQRIDTAQSEPQSKFACLISFVNHLFQINHLISSFPSFFLSSKIPTSSLKELDHKYFFLGVDLFCFFMLHSYYVFLLCFEFSLFQSRFLPLIFQFLYRIG